ncbi:MAG: GNAT family N-acetyltransferase [Opitutaceae bacterium]|nr:GNAT family N-acetyltransferase [Opitutaceae bacterium]
MTSIERLPATPAAADLAALQALLRDAVEGGASVGYVLPLPETEVAAFWRGVLASVASGSRVLLVARDAGSRIVGTVQIEFAQRPNGRHRAEVQKLLVLRTHRGRGLGFTLMGAVEEIAREARRTLLFLDTSCNGNALGLYERCGYTRAGGIPRYAADPDGSLHDNVIFYKEIPGSPAAPLP